MDANISGARKVAIPPTPRHAITLFPLEVRVNPSGLVRVSHGSEIYESTIGFLQIAPQLIRFCWGCIGTEIEPLGFRCCSIFMVFVVKVR
jgi:hypothetical protein